MVSVEKLIELGVMRKSIFYREDNQWYVLYSETGPIDISLEDLTAE
jgi:hypothetical protein